MEIRVGPGRFHDVASLGRRLLGAQDLGRAAGRVQRVPVGERPDRVRLEHRPDLVDLEQLPGVLVQPGRDHRLAVARIACRDEPAGGATCLDEAERLEAGERLPEDGPGHPELLGEHTLRWQPVGR